MNSVLISFGLGHPLPPPATSNHQTILRSTSENNPKQISSSSNSANTTPSPVPKKQHKRTCSSPITASQIPIDISGFRARPSYPAIRPNSLILNTIPPPPSSPRMTNNRHSEPQLYEKYFKSRKLSKKISSTPEEDEQITTSDDDDDDYDQYYSAQSSKLSTPMIQPLNPSSNISNSQSQLNLSCILDIDTEEQKKHQTDILPPEVDRKSKNNNKDPT